MRHERRPDQAEDALARYDDDRDPEIHNDEGDLPIRQLGEDPELQPLQPVPVTDEVDDPERHLPQTKEEDGGKAISWKDLPRKRQLIIITLARLSEPLVQTSLQAYLFYQLKWFDPSLPDSTISSQAGVLHASFMGAQFLTAMLWGRVADSHRAGRKPVLLIGLVGTSLSCLGFGFSTSFWQALLFRTLGGATNGNIGVMRTMISEIIREKKYQSRAFLLLPMTFNLGVIVGPILGGILSDPADSYPGLFGGVPFFEKYPYATPNILSSMFLFSAATAVWLGLEETLDYPGGDGDRRDLGIRVGQKLAALFRGRRHSYSSIPSGDHEENEEVVELNPDTPPATTTPPTKRFTQRLPFRRIFTRNVVLTLFAQFLMAFHIGTFNSLWFIFLSTPVYDLSEPGHDTHLPFRFTGGLGLQPRTIGLAMATLGVIGISMQLFLYPRVSTRLGTIRSWRIFLCCFPVSYFLVPYLAVVPSTSTTVQGEEMSKRGPAIWLSLIGVLLIQVLGRTFALPAQTILVNNCSPHPSVLGSVHGLGQSVSSGARTLGPMVGGLVYGVGLNAGFVGLAWWCLSGIAVWACLSSLLVIEGDGHEIWLEGDEED